MSDKLPLFLRVASSYGDLATEIERLNEFYSSVQNHSQVSAPHLLDRTLDRWFDIMAKGSSDENFLFIARQLDDLKTKLENRVISKNTEFYEHVENIISAADQFQYVMEEAIEWQSLVSKLNSLKDQYPIISEYYITPRLSVHPFKLTKEMWDLIYAQISDGDPNLAEELDDEMQSFLI